jgi:transcriptional regulator with XRE-family HTH domain
MLQKKLLARAKIRYGVTSNYALAQKMGLTRGAIHNYDKGYSFFNTKVCVTLSHILGCTPYEIIAHTELERAKRANDEKLINFWNDEIENMIGGTL